MFQGGVTAFSNWLDWVRRFGKASIRRSMSISFVVNSGAKEDSMVTIERELVKQIQSLDGEQQKQVLDFVYSLTHPRGELVRDFLERTKANSYPGSRT